MDYTDCSLLVARNVVSDEDMKAALLRVSKRQAKLCLIVVTPTPKRKWCLIRPDLRWLINSSSALGTSSFWEEAMSSIVKRSIDAKTARRQSRPPLLRQAS